jgi:ribonucleoside-diphosphate reductase alpha chain
MAMAPERMGIGIRRHFTTEGVHPYDEVTWDRRDARITNWADGKVAFEQLGVEVPSTWSVNATNILAQKYFRGGQGRPERETSLRQVIDRVADTITGWGVKDGYFVDRAEAEAFNAELKHLVLHQKAAFNSPVWFNIGVPGRPAQASACQPYDALVSTPDGLVPIGRLVDTNAIGTKVFDAHGLTRIVAVKSNGTKRVLRIQTKAGHRLDVTPDHLVWRVSGKGTGRFVEAGTLRPGDRLQWHRTESFGSRTIDSVEVAEAALAGWMQSDGFVGQYKGTNRSLTMEAMTVTPAEHEWVLSALDKVFPLAHRHERRVVTQDTQLDCRRTRIYGNFLDDFVTRWDLRARGVDMEVPPHLFDAPLPVVAAYLRSIFQAEGYVSIRERAARVGFDMISEKLVHGVQQLLLRFGIFSRVGFKKDRRPDRKGCWSLTIGPLGDRRRFADEIGFIDERKAGKLEASFQLPGMSTKPTKELEIKTIEDLGPAAVYDIQTESGEYLSENIRVHNCFILSVGDTMDEILNWYVEEGIIFKGGSGAGVNLSRIRASKERLRGGGTASGPVSFMRGADASAGTIKSGGVTRRAAKMVILDVDHPDIEEFIWCKAIEERKARALRDAGFDMDLDGRDSHSIQYQNANNSVRVTDEFMQAVVDDAEWHLTARTSGEVVQTVRARDLMRQIAQATWECADPGMQFDSTINRWHTAHNTGRINGSNPCSEYMHLDNSACNLASLNLLKFLAPDDTFDVDGFRAATSVVFTAQEILVGNADYPTEKIAETSRKFRQLGIGYANLGALLMAQGMAYDSDDGRAWAAAITALLTGGAYATSARLAARMGPFAGYHANAEHMLRVLRMHRDEVAKVDEERVPPELLSAAQEEWDAAVEMGEVYGVRNSQASVLAPTGTIGLLMDCDTTGIEPDLGLVKSKKLVGGGTMQIVNQTVPRALRQLGYTDEQVGAIVAYIDANKSIVGAPHLSPDHLSVFACSMGDNVIHHLGHVRMMAAVQPFISGAISKCVTGDTLLSTADGLVRIGSLSQGEEADTFRPEIIEVASLGGTQKTDYFYAGGLRQVYQVALGSGHRIAGTANHRLLVDVDGSLDWRRLDEIEAGDQVAVQYGDELWASLPARIGFEPAGDTKVPGEMSDDLAQLIGMVLAAGTLDVPSGRITIAGASAAVLDRAASLWRSVFGLDAEVTAGGVHVTSTTAVAFLGHIACSGTTPTARIPDAVLRSPRSAVLGFLQGLGVGAQVTNAASGRWSVTSASLDLLDDLQAVLTNLGVVHGRVSKLDKATGRTYDEVYATGPQARRLVELVPFVDPDKAATAAELGARSYPDEEERLERLHFTPVVSVDPGGMREVFDLSVPATKAFVGNGIVNHNTVNLPESATVEELEQLHIDAWRMGLKAVAVYRDNCKVAQPLSSVKKDAPKSAAQAHDQELAEKVEELEKALNRQTVVVKQPIRERLPRRRQSTTFAFRVADCEGYVTVGEYDDGRPGEVFMKVSKQGSTLAGVMDAFSISVSLGLQHGVPLKTYVQKYTNMRFEPAGMTDDPDLRIASSLVDYIFRRLAVDYLPLEERSELGILTTGERTQPTQPGVDETTIRDEPLVEAPAPAPPRPAVAHNDAPFCMTCGVQMIRAGSCHACPSCGSTSGCS